MTYIEAANPQEAAEKARYYQTKRGTTATVFDVYHAPGVMTRVDLTPETEEA